MTPGDTITRHPTFAQWVRRAFFRTVVMPLLVIELTLVGIYLASTHFSSRQTADMMRQQALEELQRLAAQEAVLLETRLEAVTSRLELLRRRTRQAHETPHNDPAEAARYVLRSDGVYLTTVDNGGAAMFYSRRTPKGPEQRDKALRLAQIDSLLRDLVQTDPIVSQAYYNTADSLNRIYPYIDVSQAFPPDMDIPSYNFFYLADAQHNPERQPRWTGAYLDPAGQGWMISHIAPVYRGEVLEGVVGMDITLKTLSRSLLVRDIPWGGYPVLLDRDGTIIALPPRGERDWGLEELTLQGYVGSVRQDTFKPRRFNIASRPGWETLMGGVMNRHRGMEGLPGDHPTLVAWETVRQTGWRLLLVAGEEPVLAHTLALSGILWDIGRWMLVGLALFYAAFLWLTWRRAGELGQRITLPLDAIQGMIRDISAGRFQPTAPAVALRELAETAQAIQSLGDTLAHAQADSQEKNRILQQEVLLHRQTALRLHEAKEFAEAGVRAKNAFLDVISQELRSPLNVILGYAHLLAEATSEARRKELSTRIQFASSALLDFLEGVLDYAAAEAGALGVRHQTFDLLDTLARVDRHVRQRAGERGLTLILDLDGQLPRFLRGDVGRLVRILDQLLDNAVKYTRQGEVVLEVLLYQRHQQRCEVLFMVRDTGPGFAPPPPGMPPQPSLRRRGDGPQAPGGLGLGLPLCHLLSRALGGWLRVHSTPGQGSCVEVLLPMDAVSTLSTPLVPLATPGMSLRALLVVANDTFCQVLTDHLREMGLAVERVADGAGLIDRIDGAAKAAPLADVLIVDQSLPDGDGLSLLRSLKGLPGVPGRMLLLGRPESVDFPFVVDKPVLAPWFQEGLRRVFFSQPGLMPMELPDPPEPSSPPQQADAMPVPWQQFVELERRMEEGDPAVDELLVAVRSACGPHDVGQAWDSLMHRLEVYDLEGAVACLRQIRNRLMVTEE
ncbi:MAG: ATP-binding protein [Magnetococcus sp. WYHC-3]